MDGFFREIRDELTLDHLRGECCPGLEEAKQVLGSLDGEQGDYRVVRDKLEEAERVLDQFNIS